MLNLFKSKWEPFTPSLLVGEAGIASVRLENVPCEKNKKNGKLRFLDDWGFRFTQWFDRYWAEKGNSPRRIVEESPLDLFIEIRGYQSVKAQVTYVKESSLDEMYSNTLDAIISALDKKSDQDAGINSVTALRDSTP
jgi:hypothetical protein